MCEDKEKESDIMASQLSRLLQEQYLDGGIDGLKIFAKCIKELKQACPDKESFSHEDIKFIIAVAIDKLKKGWEPK